MAPAATVGMSLKIRYGLSSGEIRVSALSKIERRSLGHRIATNRGSIGLPIRKLRLDTDAVDGSLASRLMRLRRDGDLPDGSVQRLRRMVNDGEMDETDVRAFTTMLERKDSDPLIDDAVDAEDLLDLHTKGDLDETLGVVKVDTEKPGLNSDFVWLEKGDSSSGFEHIVRRHGNSDEFFSLPGVNNENDKKNWLSKL